MADNISNTSELFKGGFYMDNQLNDPSLRISLHPSTYQPGSSRDPKILNGDGNSEKSDSSSGEDNRWVGYDDKDGNYSSFFTDKKKLYYSKDPIAVSLLTEDMSFSINNNFSDFNGGNAIEDIFNSAKPWAPILTTLGNNLSEATNNYKDTGSTLVKYLNEAGSKFSDFSKTAGKYLNKALFVQGTRFTYYNGSNFSFNNLDMKFVKFSDWVNGKKFRSVVDYIIEDLAPYCYGIYGNLKKDGDYVNLRRFGEIGKAASDGINDAINQYVGVQNPPGGFEMEAKNLDTAIFGTLRLNIGNMIAVENLVIKSMSFNLSKVKTKIPEKGRENETVPLYAEITLSLAPAGMITDKSFVKMLRSGSKLNSNISKEISKELTTRLDNRKKSFNN